MNKLPTSTSFQGVLDSIIRSYLLNELPPEGGESDNARNQIAERDLGAHLLNPQIFSARVQGANEVNNNAGTSTAAAAGAHSRNLGFVNPGDHEYIKAIYQCFEKRGVFKELQTFLRHKLVSILQDEWPNLQAPVAASTKDEPNTIVCRLVDDFLRCHKLLYTLSVLASESDVKLPCKKVLYGKLTSKEAEELLNDLGIKQSSRLSGQILKCYFDKEDFSLLESMHYLGIWLDESSILVDNFQQENSEGKRHSAKRKGSCGESIVLSNAKHNKDKALEARPCSCLRENKKDKGESSQIGVEERLLELERNLEKEKDFKIKEGIEKYKNEEIEKLRGELETKFKLQLVDKDREHFLEVQKRMDEINRNMHKERQQWLDEKIRQEKELCEMRKHLSEMVNASGDNLLRNATQHHSLSIGEHQSTTKVIHMATKTCQVTLDDDTVVHKCSCKKQRCSCHNDGENSPENQFHANAKHAKRRHDFHPVEQDRFAFLQYRMEQQDEEIKSLRRQLAVQISSSIPSRKSHPTSQSNGDPSPRDQAISSQVEERSPRGQANSMGKPDNLDAFLLESRRRVEILDTAVDRVDDIVQELFAKRRAPLSGELSARFLSEAVKKKKPLTPVYIPFPMTVPSTSVLSPMSYPSAVPLVHQQIPEKQTAYTPASVFHSTPAHSSNYNAVHSQNSEILTVIKPPPSQRTSLRPAILESPSINSEVQNRPETPIDKIFEVAYGGPRQVRQNVKASPKEVSEQRTSQSQGNDQSSNENSFNREPEQEESLFHMAIRNLERESSRHDDKNGKKSLGEKAIRNGALSREKILSSDEGENSQSFSRSFREKVNTTTFSVGMNGNGSKAISKSKVVKVDDIFPVKAGTSTRNGGTTQSLSKQVDKLVKSKSSSSSSSKKSMPSTRAPNKAAQNQSHSNHSQGSSRSEQDEESSINISVPKSLEGDDNMEDFWQL